MSTDNIEPTRGDAERRAALASLALGAEESTGPVEPPVVRTGREVPCGGDEARLLIKRASSLGYSTPAGYQRCGAVPGDVVLLTKGEAERLDALGVTVDPDTDLDAVADLDADGLWTDEQIKTAKAAQLVGYVATNPDERARVREFEEARTGSRKSDGPRSSVLAATEPTPVEDAEADAEATARDAAAADQSAGTTGSE